MKRLFVCVALVACQPASCTKQHGPAVVSSASTAAASASASASASTSAPSVVGNRPPGVVIDHLVASSGAYVGSPSIVVLPNGAYVASHDFFGPGTTKDKTAIFTSTDRGVRWAALAEIDGAWWSTLFVHEGVLYLIGTTKQFGRIAIRRSTDGGRTWTTPTDARSGLLTADASYHCAPVPVVVANGRIWRAFENTGKPFKAFVISAPVTADLMSAASWTFTQRILGDKSWLGGDFDNWLEGNVVIDRGGHVVDILRVNSRGNDEHVAVIHIGSDNTSATFDAAKDFVSFPGGSKKFTIRFDTQTSLYWTLSNTVKQPHTGNHTDHIRNTLSLVSSPDLATWTERSVVLHHVDRAMHAFQYVDWLFDGADIIAVSRTAYDDDASGAHSNHDANYLTFHRVANFRSASLHELR